jgi:hypothetical protein
MILNGFLPRSTAFRLCLRSGAKWLVIPGPIAKIEVWGPTTWGSCGCNSTHIPWLIAPLSESRPEVLNSIPERYGTIIRYMYIWDNSQWICYLSMDLHF